MVGITAAAPAAGLKFGASDLTPTTHTGDTNETTIASTTVPAGTFAVRALIQISLTGRISASGGANTVIKIKTGPSGSEVTRKTITISARSTEGTVGGGYEWVDIAADYSNDVVVLVTVQHVAAGTTITCETLVVIGN
ncbi:hypothetical protein LCGC14_1603100 [marine sediment metagenome]|uniref:Uncharacterized protein n=1 Tax=marine sediment metagenome TaxID=412755 RepID=A0A0F9IAY8_9ZZZZ